MLEELKDLRRELGKFKMSLLYAGIGICAVILIILTILEFLMEGEFLPVMLLFAVFMPCAFLVMLYYIYLGALMDMRKELKADECITPEISREVLLKTIQEVKNHNLEVLEQKESELARLKEKAYKTSNPFLIRKYLNEKLDFEWESFQIEMFIEFLNRDVIDNLKSLKDSENPEKTLGEQYENQSRET